jgi:hypothetical protein
MPMVWVWMKKVQCRVSPTGGGGLVQPVQVGRALK